MDIDTLTDAGVYDPGAPDAVERLAVLRWLLDQGVSVEQILDADRRGSLFRAGLDAILWPEGGGLTMGELAAAAGTTEGRVRRVRRLVGLTDPGDFAVGHRREIDLLHALDYATQLFGEEQAIEFARVLGLSSAAIAEAAISMFAVSVAEPMRDVDGTDLEYVQRVREATRSFSAARDVVDVLLRLHFEQAVDRLTSHWDDDAGPRDEVVFTIAFVDLAESTRIAARGSSAGFASAIRDFEAAATDAAAAQGARVVKLLGDNAMIAGPGALGVAEAALDVVQRVAADERFEGARAGVASGRVTARGGDYFGGPVNLASRLTEEALPGEVLCDGATADHLPGRVRELGTRIIRGLEDLVAVYEVAGEG